MRNLCKCQLQLLLGAAEIIATDTCLECGPPSVTEQRAQRDRVVSDEIRRAWIRFGEQRLQSSRDHSNPYGIQHRGGRGAHRRQSVWKGAMAGMPEFHHEWIECSRKPL